MPRKQRAPASFGFQVKRIEQILGSHDIAKHEFDVAAEVDPTLRLGENVALIKKTLGLGVQRKKTKKEIAHEERGFLIDQCMRTEKQTECGVCCDVTKDAECCEIAQEKQKPKHNFSERASLYGASKRRWRCPKCLRAFRSDGECEEHGGIEYAGAPLDLKTMSTKDKWYVVEIELTDLFSNRYPKKREWSYQDIHKKTGITVSYLKKEFPPEYLMQRGVAIKFEKKELKRGVKKVIPTFPKRKTKPKSQKKPKIGLHEKILTDKQIQEVRKRGWTWIIINKTKKKVTKQNIAPRKRIILWYQSGKNISLKRLR